MIEKFALEFEHVNKGFSSEHSLPDKLVVRDLSFKVKEGEFFSILGPSGCGKTTCLRLISGLESPTSGSIRMAGKVVNDVHPHKRNVHTVFQKYALFPHLNVFENVAFGLRMKSRPASEIRSRVDRMLKMVHLEDHAYRPVTKLSGGEQQRVALIRALVNEPAILLLDEPLGALDLKLREQMQQELAVIQKKLGTTFVFVTHDQGEALTLSDRIAIMNRGSLEQVGTPTEVYEHPTTTFVANFVGTTNAFSGKLTQAPGALWAIATENFGTLFAKIDEATAAPIQGSEVALVVRPEKIRIRVTAPTASDQLAGGSHTVNTMRGVLIERTYFGPTTQIKLQIHENLPPVVALVANQTATKMPSLKIGERYFAVWDASDSVIVRISKNGSSLTPESQLAEETSETATQSQALVANH